MAQSALFTLEIYIHEGMYISMAKSASSKLEAAGEMMEVTTTTTHTHTHTQTIYDMSIFEGRGPLAKVGVATPTSSSRRDAVVNNTHTHAITHAQETCANLRVESVSPKLESAGEMLEIMAVLHGFSKVSLLLN